MELKFEQIYCFKTLNNYGKTMVLWKILWYYGKHYSTIVRVGTKRFIDRQIDRKIDI